jgi:hypothetical protein
VLEADVVRSAEERISAGTCCMALNPVDCDERSVGSHT